MFCNRLLQGDIYLEEFTLAYIPAWTHYQSCLVRVWIWIWIWIIPCVLKVSKYFNKPNTDSPTRSVLRGNRIVQKKKGHSFRFSKPKRKMHSRREKNTLRYRPRAIYQSTRSKPRPDYGRKIQATHSLSRRRGSERRKCIKKKKKRINRNR